MRVRAEGSLVGLLGERPVTGRAGHPFARLAVEVAARGRRGSGYLVGEDTVLTAAQPVRRAARIVIRLDGGREAVAAVVWLDVDADLAVLRLTPGAGPVPPSPVRFGRMRSRPLSIDVSTAAGPAVGTVVGGSSDTLDIAAESQPGAVAFAGGLAVGVVTARDRYAVARLDHHLGHARAGRGLAALLEAGPLIDVA
jgi:S1-C subfamily serine protease